MNEKDLFKFDLEKESTGGEYVDPAIQKMSDKIGESDVPSIFLPGSRAGAFSGYTSEDPAFVPIQDTVDGPPGVVLSDKDRFECQNASMKRRRIDPQYTAILDTYHSFTIGKGVTITPEDESDEVKEYVDDFIKLNKFNGLDSDIVLSIFEAGEIFIRFFYKSGNLPARIPAIRLLYYWEISKIKYDYQTGKPVTYVRPYREEGETEVKYEDIPADEILHVKFGSNYQKRGLPAFLPIIQQCQYYLDWLYCRIVLNRLKSSYYLEEIVDSTPASVSGQDAQTPDSTHYGESGKPQKRLPKIGSKIVHNKSVEYKWLKPEVGADDAKEDGRSIRLAICAGAQVPEFVLGDASNANYNSALVAQNPFVRRVEWFRDFFEKNIKQIMEKVITYGINNNFLPSKSTETVMKERASNVGLIRRLKKLFRYQEAFDPAGNIVVTSSVDTKTEVNVEWPNLIAENILQDSQAYQIHQGMGIVSNETIASKLGYDYEEEWRKIQNEQEQQSEAMPDPMEPDPDEEEPDLPEKKKPNEK
jgi:hypothetical protein